MVINIDELPDEVLQQVLYYVPPRDTLLNTQRVCQRFLKLSNEPLLWRYHCLHEFKYWDPSHKIKHAFSGDVGDVNWKNKLAYRYKANTETTRTLDDILGSQVGRITKFEKINQIGYDAKDILLQHCNTQEEHDILARKYYANAVLDLLHRSKSLAEWSKLGKGEAVSIERTLGSFDLFILHDQHGDLSEASDPARRHSSAVKLIFCEQTSELLNDLAAQVRSESPNISQLSSRERALTAVRFLRKHNLVGLATESDYRHLQNNYIGIALQHREHPSLPAIASAIFCALARRLKLDAQCCGLPSHVYAMVISKKNEDLDGNSFGIGPLDCMYLDPYRSEKEVQIEYLQRLLASWGVHQDQMACHLGPTPNATMAIRTSRNILTTVQEFRQQQLPFPRTDAQSAITLYANPYADLESAFYSALWANFMLSNSSISPGSRTQREFISILMEKFERNYPMDACLILKYISHVSNGSPNTTNNVDARVAVTLQVDSIPKQVRARKHTEHQSVKYRVGQVFRHRRYGYTAVVTGWDTECGLCTDWIVRNGIDRLSRGRHQSFYHALVEDSSTRYVAEENVDVIEPEVPVSLMSLAGKYFKRWDPVNHVFVSNIREEYPDD